MDGFGSSGEGFSDTGGLTAIQFEKEPYHQTPETPANYPDQQFPYTTPPVQVRLHCLSRGGGGGVKTPEVVNLSYF